MTLPPAAGVRRWFIVDAGQAPPAQEPAAVLLWNGYSADPPSASVSAHLEAHAERLRAKYLAFIYDLGQSIVGGRRLVDHFRQRDGYSFWWMNRVAEKSPFKSRRIFDCLRLLALEEMLVERRARQVTLQTSDRNLAEAVKTLCDGLGAEFVWARLPPPAPQPLSLRRAYEALPHWMQGLLSFRHLFLRRRFRSLRPIAWASGSHSMLLCSYLFNLDPEAARRGEFHSHQWEGLPAWLRDHGIQPNWIHQYLPDAGRGVAASAELLRTFNKDAARQGRHALLETYLSLRAAAAIAANWFRHLALAWRLRDAARSFRMPGSHVSMWPLLRDDWRNSMTGTAAVTSCACRVLFDAAVKDLPRQPRGVFLFEGQGWETAFVHAWRKHGHGEIVGAPHTSMPFWYLSIYDDARQYRDGSEKPLPDRWAVNGRHAWAELAAAGMPETRMAAVEALRFQYLAGLSTRRRERPSADGQPLRLLVLGDFTRRQTLKMIRCLERALPLFAADIRVTIKRHPVCPLEPADAGAMRCEFTDRPVGEILPQFDLAFASNTTSAALDALLMGLPVIVYLDDEGFNQSPLRRAAHVRFVSAPAGLAAAIQALAGERVDVPVDEFFWVDASFPKWSALLSVEAPVHG